MQSGHGAMAQYIFCFRAYILIAFDTISALVETLIMNGRHTIIAAAMDLYSDIWPN